MPLTPLDRKAELVRRGISFADLSRQLGVTAQHIGLVVAGKRRSPRIEAEVARLIGLPVTLVFSATSAAA